MTDELTALETWYASQCDGDWEHQDGIEINTLDNPGWRVVIDITDTELAGKSFPTVEENYEHDAEWLRCWVEQGKFNAASGPRKLSRVLRIFLDWADQHSAPSRNAV
jgi:hypothetical protein